MKRETVCFFDSGIGGLTLFAECVRKYPFVDFIYFADNDHVPYGNRDPGEIWRLTCNVFKKIREIRPVAAVVACNTVTAICIDRLRSEYPFPIIGIQPAVKPAVEEGKHCLVLATNATVNSVSFLRLIERYGQERVTVRACSGLAEYIERHIEEYPDIDVTPLLPTYAPEAVVLGCTHYTFAGKSIGKYYGCPIYDGILGTADHLGEFLGTADHFCLNKQNIAFFGGDINKNRKIFNKLIERKTT